MSQSGYTPILIYASGTATNVPLAANLTSGASGAELALNYADGKLYYKDSGGVVQLLAGKGGAGIVAGSNTQVQFNNNGVFGASSGLTWDGTTLAASNISTAGNLTLSGGTANGVLYLNGSKVATSGSALTFDGTTFQYTGAANFATSTGSVGIGTSSPAYKLDVRGGVIAGGNGTIVGGISYSTRPEIGAISNHPCGFITNNTTQMLLDTSGNLGIGTSSPNQKLDVAGSLQIRSSGTSYLNNSDNTNQYYWQNIGATGANNATLILSRTNAGETLRVDSSGNLGLGVTPISGARMSVGGSSNFPVLKISRTDLSFDTGVLALGDGNSSAINVGVWRGAANSVASTGNWLNLGGYSGITFNCGNAAIGSQTQAMTLDASGNLGVGTTVINGYYGSTSVATRGVYAYASSSTNCDTAPKGLVIRNDDTTAGNLSQLVFGSLNTGNTPIASASIWSINDARSSGFSTGSLAFGTVGGSGVISERARIDSDGNLLVNSTSISNSPARGVQLWSGSSNSIGGIAIGHDTGVATGNYFAVFNYASGVIGSITQSGTTAVLYNVTSDQRLKENIVDAPEFGSVIDSIKVRSYDWKADGNHQRAGFIAQELVTVAPEAVHQPADPEEMMAVDYSKLVPMLVKEIQSLRARVAQLESN